VGIVRDDDRPDPDPKPVRDRGGPVFGFESNEDMEAFLMKNLKWTLRNHLGCRLITDEEDADAS